MCLTDVKVEELSEVKRPEATPPDTESQSHKENNLFRSLLRYLHGNVPRQKMVILSE